MKKRAHKVLGIELRASNIVRASDPAGKVDREELDWTALSGAQQALLEGHAKRRLGQASPS